MRVDRFSFGSIRIDGTTYENDVVLDRGKVRKRKKKASKPFRPAWSRCRGVAPDLIQVALHRFDAPILKLVDAPGPDRLVDDEAGILEQAQMTGDRRPADGKRVGELAYGPAARPEQLDDGAPIGIAERVEGIAGQGGGHRP